MQARGHEVEFISASQDYRSAKKNRRRMVREFLALGSIFMRAWRTRRPDVVISGTSPPCLLVAAALCAIRHGAKSAHWLMDMYPELAVALGEVRPGFVSRVIGSLMGWAYRRSGLVVALDEDMAARLKEYGVSAEIVPPWVLDPLMKAAPTSPVEPDAEWTWIYSGNLGRAHEWETLLQIQVLLEQKNLPCRLLFQGGGPSWPLAQARAAELGLKRCAWKSYVPESELQTSLLRARVLVVTQRPETQGMLWPSKLALATTLPRPILWIGPTDGAIARQLGKLPQAGVFAPGQAAEAAEWIAQRFESTATIAATDSAKMRDAALEKWERLLTQIVGP
jgi:hypothetical protein